MKFFLNLISLLLKILIIQKRTSFKFKRIFPYILILNKALLCDAPTSVSLVQNLRVNFSSKLQNRIKEMKLFIKASKSKINKTCLYYNRVKLFCLLFLLSLKAWANVSNYSSNKSSNCLMENFENLMESNFHLC